MRVLLFNYEYPPLGGGAGNACYYLLREFSKETDLTVDLITSSLDKEYHQEKITEEIIIHRLPIGKNSQNLHFQTKKDLLTYTTKAYWKAKSMIKNNNYDLTHAFFGVPSGLISWLIFIESKIPYIISLRGSDVPGYSERFIFLYKIIKPLVKSVWHQADYLVANSQGLKELAIKTSKKKEIDVIYNGVDTKEFFPSIYGIYKSSLKDKKEESIFNIICVSRITPRKGIRYLIKAVSWLKVRHPKINLKIIGEGNEREELEKLVKKLDLKDTVQFLGLIEHYKLVDYYQKADIFVLPSLNEGMSNTILEAMACGLPIITTDTGGTKELVENGKNGLIVDKKNSRSISEILAKLIKNPELCTQMGEASRKAVEKFSWEKVAEDYLELYEEIVSRKYEIIHK